MLCAVIAAANEEDAIQNVLIQLHRAGITRCFIVVNGSADATRTRAHQVGRHLFVDFAMVHYTDPCGPDVPHAIGLVLACRKWPDSDWYLLLDGDLQGAFGPALAEWLTSAINQRASGVWIAARTGYHRLDQQLWQSVLAKVRPELTNAAPAQVPRLVHVNLLSQFPPQAFWHPGLWIAYCAARTDIQLAVIPFDAVILGNRARSRLHQERMQETLIGDALEGTRLLLKKKPHRHWRGRTYRGYHPHRRIDLLLTAMQSIQIFV